MLYDCNMKVNEEKTFAVLPAAEIKNRDIDMLINFLEEEVVKIYTSKIHNDN